MTKRNSLTFKRRKNSRWYLEWMDPEMCWLVVGPVSVMSGHLPTIDQMSLFEITKEDWKDLFWSLTKLSKLKLPEPIYIKGHPKYGDKERARKLMSL